MIPKLVFEAVDNPDGMISIINQFLLHSGKGFNWSGVYAKEYPSFGRLISKVRDSEEVRKISGDFFRELYDSNLNRLKIIAKNFQKEWDKDGGKLLAALAEVTEKKWPKDCKEMKAWVSLNPICPRFLDERAFDVYWRKSPGEMKETCLHEILHFIWFEKWKEVFPIPIQRGFEAPHLVWKLSEMVPWTVLNDERIQKIFRHTPSVYEEWKFKQIEGKPLLEHIQGIYNQRKSFADFIKLSWKFVQKHEKEINER